MRFLAWEAVWTKDQKKSPTRLLIFLNLAELLLRHPAMASMEYSEDNRCWYGFMMFHVSRLALSHSWQDSKMSTKINFATADRFFFDLVSIFRTYAMIWSDTKMKAQLSLVAKALKMKRWSRFLCLRVRRLSKKESRKYSAIPSHISAKWATQKQHCKQHPLSYHWI